MNKLRIVVFSIILALAVFGAILLRSSPALHLYSSQVVARNINFPDYQRGKIRFFTGSSLAELDPNTGHTRALTPEYSLPEVSDLIWGDHQVIFQASTLSTNDDLYAKATQSVKSRPYSWWLIDVQNGKLEYLGAHDPLRQLVQVIWQADGKGLIELLQKGDDTSDQVIQKVNSEGKIASSIPLSDASILYDSSRGVIIQEGQNILLYQDNKLTKTDAETSIKPMLASDSDFLVYEKPSNKPTKELWAFNLRQLKSQKILSNKLNSNNYLVLKDKVLSLPDPPSSGKNFVSSTARLIYKQGNDFQFTKIQIEAGDSLRIGHLSTGGIIGSGPKQQGFAIVKKNGDCLLLNSNPSVRQVANSYPLFFMDEPELRTAKYNLFYDDLSNQLTISIHVPGSPQKLRAQIYQELKQGGRDPNQVKKVWISASDKAE